MRTSQSKIAQAQVRVASSSAKFAEALALRIAALYPLSRIDGRLIRGERGDWLVFVQIATDEVEP
jgi:hypothetical protein